MTAETKPNSNGASAPAAPKLEFKTEPPTASDPAVYAEYESKWATYPTDAEGWLQRARDVAAVLAIDAAARERANKSPRAEVALLRHSGLLRLLGPKKYGGGEQPLSVGYQAIREVAAGDG
jgi:alkylation response protein AidB-like acyl-CoA dehydrogenase